MIEKALQHAPDNSLLRFQLMEILIKEENRTLLLEEVERMKEKDPDCLIAIRLNIRKLTGEEKYDEAFRMAHRQPPHHHRIHEADNDRRTRFANWSV